MDEELPDTKKPTLYFIIIACIVLVAILLFVIFGLKREAKPNTVEYGYFTFEEIGGLWQTSIQLDDQLYDAMFRFNPTQVLDVEVLGNFSGFQSEPIYITFDPDVPEDDFKYLALASSELSLNLVRALNFTVEAACTKNLTDACFNRSIVACDSNKSVVYLSTNPPPQILLKGSCVTVKGEGLDLLKSVDRLLFQWYKIMK